MLDLFPDFLGLGGANENFKLEGVCVGGGVKGGLSVKLSAIY